MVTTIYLIRHGETEGSGAMRYKGSIDVPLSRRGLDQMKRASEFIQQHVKHAPLSKLRSYLKDVQPRSGEAQGWREVRENDDSLTAVYSSTLSRSVRSAEVIAAPFGLTPVPLADLRERHFGIWEGMSFLEIQEAYRDQFESWAANPLEHSPPGGESTLQVRDRAQRALNGLLNAHRGENIAVVAHGGVNRVMLCQIMGAPLENMFRIEQDCAGINIIEFWDRYPVVKLLNGGPRG